MAIMTAHGGMFRSSNRIDLNDCAITATDGDVQVILKDGRKISMAELLERVEALETLYMEKVLLGSDPGKIEE